MSVAAAEVPETLKTADIVVVSLNPELAVMAESVVEIDKLEIAAVALVACNNKNGKVRDKTTNLARRVLYSFAVFNL